MNMTPMIDIVFLLIIFFMTVTQVSKVNKMQLDLPELEAAKEQKPSELVINIDVLGDIFISGTQRTIPEVESLLADELVANGGNPDMLTIVIRADRNAQCKPVNEVVSSLEGLGLKRVRIAIQKSG